MRKKWLFLFLLLSVTPFIRGCGETFGFPLAAMNGIISSGDLSGTWKNLLEALSSSRTLIIIAANVLFAALFASIASRKAGRVKWIPHFIAGLAIGILMTWAMTGLYIFDVEMDDPKNLPEKIAKAYGAAYGFIYVTAPETASSALADLNLWGPKKKKQYGVTDVVRNTLEDVFNRAWFVIVALLMGWVFYAAGRLLNSRI